MLGGPSRQRLVGATSLLCLVAHQGNDLLVQRAYYAWWPIKATTCWCNKATLLGGPTRLHCLVAQQASIAMSRMQLDVLYSMCLTNASRHALSYLMSMLCLSYVYLMSILCLSYVYLMSILCLMCLTQHAYIAMSRMLHISRMSRMLHISRMSRMLHV